MVITSKIVNKRKEKPTGKACRFFGNIAMFNELTQNDIRKMEEEIEYRKCVVRKEALEDVKEARAHGDLSENFEYHAAKKVKNQNESRIRYLERMIRTAVIIEDDSKLDEIGLNDTFEIWIEEDDVMETYKLVTTVREDTLNGLISVESPMGKAVLYHKVGDRVTIKVNENYSYDVIIKNIIKSDEENDELRKF